MSNAWLAAGAAGMSFALAIRAAQGKRARARFAEPVQRSASAGRARVRILQPIRSGDPRLSRTLAAMRDEHLGLESERELHLEWLVDEDDPAGVTAASSEAQGRVAIVRCPPPPAGVNPKSRKLAERIRSMAGDEIVVVVDDDTLCSRAGLDALLAALDGGAMIATGLPRYERSGPLPARLVADWVNGQAATSYLGLRGPAISINGMCHAMRVADLRAIGGYEAIERLVVDDLALAELVRSAGGTIVQTSVAQRVGTEVASVRELARLLHRWMAFANLALVRSSPRDRFRIAVGLAAPPALLSISLAALALAASQGRPMLAGTIAALGLAVRTWLLDAIWRSAGPGRPGSRAGALVMELLVPAFAVSAAIHPVISWRGRRLRLGRDGRILA